MKAANIRNTSKYDGAVMRRLLQRVVSEVTASLLDHHPLRDTTANWNADRVMRRAGFIESACQVWIRNRAYSRSGRANLGGGRMTLSLGPVMTTAEFLWLARHEVWHLFGVGHDRMPDAIRHRHWDRGDAALQIVRGVYSNELHEVGELLPLAVAAPKAAPVPADAQVEAKLAAIVAREKRWTTKLRRAETALAKLKKSRKYYERKLALLNGTESEALAAERAS